MAVAFNPQDPMLGYDFNELTEKCYLSMLQNPAWYNKAVALSANGDTNSVLNALANFAIAAAQLYQIQFNNVTSTT